MLMIKRRGMLNRYHSTAILSTSKINKMPGRLIQDEYDRQLQRQREEIERARREREERERRVREKEQQERELKDAILRATGGRIPRELRDMF